MLKLSKAGRFLSVLIAATALAQRPEYGPCCFVRLASPDGSRVLFTVPYQEGVNDGAQLWIENRRTHQRRMLLGIQSTVSARWSADGNAFYVELSDADETLSYIYETATLQQLDLRARILESDPDTRRFAKEHTYFDVVGWQGLDQVIVHLQGNTYDPVVCFDSRYRVNRNGAVAKLSPLRVFRPGGRKGC